MATINFEKMEQIPASAFKNVTAGAENNNLVSGSDFAQTADHTKAEITYPNPGTPDMSQQPGQPPIATNPTGTKLGSLVGGKTGADFIDILIPSLCVWLVSMIGYNISKARLQMTAKEKETLAPALQAWLDSINVNLNNPLNNLLLALGIIYGSKTIDIISARDFKKAEESKIEKGKVIELKPETEWSVEDYVKEISKRMKRSKIDAINFFQQHEEKFRNMPFEEAYKQGAEENKSNAKRNKK